jgi:hypothetical protein
MESMSYLARYVVVVYKCEASCDVDLRDHLHDDLIVWLLFVCTLRDSALCRLSASVPIFFCVQRYGTYEYSLVAHTHNFSVRMFWLLLLF